MTEQNKPLTERDFLTYKPPCLTPPVISELGVIDSIEITRGLTENEEKLKSNGEDEILGKSEASDPVDSSDLTVCTANAAKTLLDESKENVSGVRTVAIDVESNAGISGWSADQAYWDAWDRKTQRKLNRVEVMSRKHWKKLENKFLREAKKSDGMLKTRKLSKWYIGFLKKVSRTTGYLKLGDPKPHSIIDNPYLRDAFYAGLSDEVITGIQPGDLNQMHGGYAETVKEFAADEIPSGVTFEEKDLSERKAMTPGELYLVSSFPSKGPAT